MCEWEGEGRSDVAEDAPVRGRLTVRVVGTDDIVEVRPEGECEHDNVEDLVSDAVEEGHDCEL